MTDAGVRAGGLHTPAEAAMGRWFTDRFRAAHLALIARFRATMAGRGPSPSLDRSAAG